MGKAPGRATPVSGPHPCTQRRTKDDHKTGTDRGQGKSRAQAPVHVFGASAHARVSARDVEADESQGRERSGWGDDEGVRERPGNEGRAVVRAAQGEAVSTAA